MKTDFIHNLNVPPLKTKMGAIEALGAVVQEGFGDIARAMKGEY